MDPALPLLELERALRTLLQEQLRLEMKPLDPEFHLLENYVTLTLQAHGPRPDGASCTLHYTHMRVARISLNDPYTLVCVRRKGRVTPLTEEVLSLSVREIRAEAEFAAIIQGAF